MLRCIFVFIPFGILWDSWICGLLSVINLGNCQWLSLQIFLLPHSVSLLLRLPLCVLNHLSLSHTSWCLALSLLNYLFTPCVTVCLNFYWPTFKLTDFFPLCFGPVFFFFFWLHPRHAWTRDQTQATAMTMRHRSDNAECLSHQWLPIEPPRNSLSLLINFWY